MALYEVLSTYSCPVRSQSIYGVEPMSLTKREKLIGLLSILPIFLFLSVFFYYPTLNTFFHSFTKWDGLNETWIGLKNYRDIFSSGDVWLLLRNNMIFVLAYPGIFLFCMIVTVLLHEQVAGWRFFRSVFYIPTILSTVVVGFLMKVMFSYDGTVNQWLRMFKLDFLATTWFDQTVTAFIVLIFCYYWQTLGQGVLILLAGMSSIPEEMYDASKIDGANWWQRLFQITLPSLVQPIFYFTFINVTWAFIGLFPLIYSVTGGGPGYSTTPIDFMIYIKGFMQNGEMGYASALSVILFILVMIVSWIQFRVSERLSE